MPEVRISIGGRDYEVACQAGEEHYLQAAAGLLNAEASALVDQIGRIPEARMLLMAGLMLADKAAGHDDQVRELRPRIKELEAEDADLSTAPAPEAKTVEVPVVPQEVMDTLAELAARAESLADAMEEVAGAA